MQRWILAALFISLLLPLFGKENLVRTFVDNTGKLVNEYTIPDVPVSQRISGPKVKPTRNAVMLTDIPAYDWSYGCAATSAAMIAGYYDRHGFSNIYTGPTNSGIAPLNNSVWGAGECPISATHTNFDNLTTTGHVNRFYVSYQNSGNDPFGTGDPTSLYSSCTADYMGTNQDWWNNGDGSTTIYTYNNGNPIYDYTYPETQTPRKRDGIRGLKLFYQSRGYVVTSAYNQLIAGWNNNTAGFTFANYMAQIDAGVPVFIQVQGHTMVGVGYDSSNNTVYLHDTWDYNVHSMTWGGSYSGMAQFAVSVITLAPATIAWAPTAITQDLMSNQTASQNLTISNPGSQLLNYACSVANPTNTVTTALDETFTTTSLPTGWSQVFDTGTTSWVFSAEGNPGATQTAPYDGAYYACFYCTDYSYPMTKLVTPALNLSGVSSASLSFWHAQREWGGDIDELNVYYKTSATGTWNLLSSYTSSIATWTQEVINLPNLSGTYYIGFQGKAKYGFGVCLDKVVVTKQAAATPWLSINGGTSYTGSIVVSGVSNQIPLNINSSGLAVGTYSASINVTSNSTTNSTFTVPVTLNVVGTPISIVSPTSTTVWQAASSQSISWQYRGTGTTVALSYSSNGGTTWTSVGNIPTTVGTNSYNWTIPYIASNNVKIRLVDSISPNYAAISDVFTLTCPTITVNQTSIALGTTLINTSTTRTINISNTGTALLQGNITTPAGYTISVSREANAVNHEEIIMATARTKDVTSIRNTLAYTVPAGSNVNFTLTFTPTVVQNYNGSITVTHNAGGSNKTITLTGAGGKPTIAKSAVSFSANLAPGQTNNQTLTISNTGSLSLNYGLTISGSVPWLSINTGTTYSNTIAAGGAAQSITLGFNSTGYAPGTYTAIINGTSNDPSNLTYNISVSLTVRAPITVTTPAGGETWSQGTNNSIKWGYTGAGSTVTLYYSTNGGTSWTSIGSQTTAQGTNTYSWRVPVVSSTNCKIKFVDSVSPNYAVTSNVFTITAAGVAPTGVKISKDNVTGNLVLTWNSSSSATTGYHIYSCPNPNFAVGETTLVTSTTTSVRTYTIPVASVTNRKFYRVTAY